MTYEFGGFTKGFMASVLPAGYQFGDFTKNLVLMVTGTSEDIEKVVSSKLNLLIGDGTKDYTTKEVTAIKENFSTLDKLIMDLESEIGKKEAFLETEEYKMLLGEEKTEILDKITEMKSYLIYRKMLKKASMQVLSGKIESLSVDYINSATV